METETTTQWHLYIIRCRGGTLYTGIATDVDRRLQEHRSTGAKGAKYLRGRGPLELAYCRKIGDRGLALKVEYAVKRLSKAHKSRLITGAMSLDDIVYNHP